MGAGRGKGRRASAAVMSSTAPALPVLSDKAQDLLERALSMNKVSPAQSKELIRWAEQYSSTGKLKYAAALVMFALSGHAEKQGRKINKRTPEREREVLFQRAEKDFKNYTDIGIAAEFEAMHYLTETYPEETLELDEDGQATWEEGISTLREKTGLDSFKKWPAYIVRWDSEDPLVGYIMDSLADDSPFVLHPGAGTATFVPDEDGFAQPPIIITEGLVSNPELPAILVHESTHVAYNHTTKAGAFGIKVIEGSTDTQTWLALEEDWRLYERNPRHLYYAHENKFALALALTHPCADRDELIKSLSRLSANATDKKKSSDFCTKHDKELLDSYLGATPGAVDWSKFYKQNACDDGVNVNELRDRIVAAAELPAIERRQLEEVTNVGLGRMT